MLTPVLRLDESRNISPQKADEKISGIVEMSNLEDVNTDIIDSTLVTNKK